MNTFPDGAVRATRLDGSAQDDQGTISFAELLDAPRLTEALLTTFLVDPEWLLAQVGDGPRITLIADRSRGKLDPRITMVYPELVHAGSQIVHTKLMVLFYPWHVRVVVGSGNLVADDWSVMQNVVFVQDFAFDPNQVFSATEFSMTLAFTLHDLGAPFRLVARLNHVDFAPSTGIHLVSSVPTGGPRQAMNMKEYGVLRLAAVIGQIRQNNPSDDPEHFDPDSRLYCTTSSLGRLDSNWLRDFYLCAHGLDPQSLTLAQRKDLVSDDLVDIGVGFHTQVQVDNCRFGAHCGQYIMGKRRDYEHIPDLVLMRLEPRVQDSLVHAKVILSRVGSRQDTGWMYVGSHNFTPAAWGRLRRNEEPYFNNYELGVVLPVTFKGDDVLWRGSPVPLPFRQVWQPLGKADTPHFSDPSS